MTTQLKVKKKSKHHRDINGDYLTHSEEDIGGSDYLELVFDEVEDNNNINDE